MPPKLFFINIKTFFIKLSLQNHKMFIPKVCVLVHVNHELKYGPQYTDVFNINQEKSFYLNPNLKCFFVLIERT